MLFEARKKKVHYRARKVAPDGTFGEWQRGVITMVVQPSAEDPEGDKAIEKRVRFAREKNRIELEVFSIVDEGDEIPLEGGTKEGIPTVVSPSDYEGLKRKNSLVYPGHPLWEKSKLIH